MVQLGLEIKPNPIIAIIIIYFMGNIFKFIYLSLINVLSKAYPLRVYYLLYFLILYLAFVQEIMF